MKKTLFLIVLMPFIANFYGCMHEPIKGKPNVVIKLEDRDSNKVYFVNDLLPIIRSSCAVPGCHDSQAPAANVDLSTYESIMNSVVRGDTIVHPFKPGISILNRALRGQDILISMPTPFNFQITETEKNMIGKWVAQGALNNECKQTCSDLPITYTKTIKPLINKYCTGCHFGDYAQDGIELEAHSQIAEIALDGRLMNSLLGINNVSRMPQLTAMPNCEIEQIRKWIADGAPKN